MVYVLQELCKVYIRLDQPTAALALYEAASQRQPSNTSLLLGCARIHDALNDVDKGLEVYKQVSGMLFCQSVWYSDCRCHLVKSRSVNQHFSSGQHEVVCAVWW